jgi:hypothetical protein
LGGAFYGFFCWGLVFGLLGAPAAALVGAGVAARKSKTRGLK